MNKLIKVIFVASLMTLASCSHFSKDCASKKKCCAKTEKKCDMKNKKQCKLKKKSACAKKCSTKKKS